MLSSRNAKEVVLVSARGCYRPGLRGSAAAVTDMFPWRRMFPNTGGVSLARDALEPNGGPRQMVTKTAWREPQSLKAAAA